MLITVANVLFLIFFPLLFIGLINRVKSFWAGRQGPSALQPFRDFWRLMKKGEVVSTTTSFVFTIAPSVTLASVIAASLVVPLFCGRSLIPFDLDFVLFAYVLAAGKFFAILGAMDTGSSFEGMGASREATFGSLVEPAFFIMIARSPSSQATSFEG
jgi:formate hydrogenlyase subunit 4